MDAYTESTSQYLIFTLSHQYKSISILIKQIHLIAYTVVKVPLPLSLSKDFRIYFYYNGLCHQAELCNMFHKIYLIIKSKCFFLALHVTEVLLGKKKTHFAFS